MVKEYMKTKIDITNTIVCPKGYYILEDQETVLNKDDLYWNGKSWANMNFLNINDNSPICYTILKVELNINHRLMFNYKTNQNSQILTIYADHVKLIKE
jgi:hypothetical protein